MLQRLESLGPRNPELQKYCLCRIVRNCYLSVMEMRPFANYSGTNRELRGLY